MATPERRHFGKCIELKAECIDEYKRLHADGHAGVRDLLTKYNLVNFSIYLHEIRGAHMLFLYCEVRLRCGSARRVVNKRREERATNSSVMRTRCAGAWWRCDPRSPTSPGASAVHWL